MKTCAWRSCGFIGGAALCVGVRLVRTSCLFLCSTTGASKDHARVKCKLAREADCLVKQALAQANHPKVRTDHYDLGPYNERAREQRMSAGVRTAETSFVYTALAHPDRLSFRIIFGLAIIIQPKCIQFVDGKPRVVGGENSAAIHTHKIFDLYGFT